MLHYSNVWNNPQHTSEIFRFVDAARSDGVAVAIVAPVPYAQTNVLKTLYEGGTVAQDAAAHRRATQGFAAFRARVEPLGVFIADPADVLCPAGSACRFADARGVPYYFDESHLTHTGARQLEGLLGQALEGLRRTQGPAS